MRVLETLHRKASVNLFQENVALGAGFEYNYWNIANWNRKPE